MSTSLRRVVIIFGLNLLVFLIARLGIWLVYQDDFRDLAMAELLIAFLRGEWFDFSVIALTSGLPLLMLLLPFQWASNRVWTRFWVWTGYGLLSVLMLLLAADLVYFGFVHRHVGPEIASLGADPELLVDMAFGGYAWALVLYLVACVGLFLLWKRWLHHGQTQSARLAPGLAVFVVALVGTAVLARGGFNLKPIDIVDAFTGNPPSAAYLSLNGPFAMSHSFMNARAVKADFFPWPEAVARTRHQVLSSGERPLAGDDYPLVRDRPEASNVRRPNVVVLMLESWDAAHIDVLRRHMGLEPFGATPNFDALARQGQLYTRFYANGERSMDGLAALLAGIPTLPGTAYLGMGMEQNRMAYLGRMARKEGYETLFLQSSKRQSFHVDAIAAIAGFTTYLGAEDIPADGHSERRTERGAWDHDMFQEANRRFAGARKPFVGFVFTASTHLPFQSPGRRWQKFAPDTMEHRFLNSLYYADWALGEFFVGAKKSGYYDNTIFILTADHISGLAGLAGDVPSLHHVPLLMIAPGLKPGLIARTGGQVDVIPTIAELAGWRARQASLGRSLLDKNPQAVHGTFCVRGNVIERIEDRGWVAHNLHQRVGASAGTRQDDLKAMEERLLSMYQVAHTLLLRNGIAPPEQERDILTRR